MPIDIGTGILHEEFQDVSIPGKFALTWDRNYSTSSLMLPAKPLGLGWTNAYFCSLSYREGVYEFLGPTGTIESFPDPNQLLQEGQVLINFGAFQDLRFRNGKFIIRHWGIETTDVTLYIFEQGEKTATSWPIRAIEDPTGQGLDLLYDQRSRLSTIGQRLEGQRLLLSYDESGWIDQITYLAISDRPYNLATYTHDDLGRLISVADSAGFEDKFEYDGGGRLTRQIIKDGSVFSTRYDSQERCIYMSGLERYDEKHLTFFDTTGQVQVVDSTGAVWHYKCLSSGQIYEETNPLGSARRFTYDDYGRLSEITDEMAARSSCSYDLAGNLASVTDRLGHSFYITYNDARLRLSATDPTGGISKLTYDHLNQLTSTEAPGGAVWSYTYDREGNLIRIRNPVGVEKRLSFSRGYLISGTDWEGHTSHYRLDDFARLIEKIDPLGFVTEISYDQWGNLAGHRSADGSVRRAEYDAVGNLIRYIDADGSITRFFYGNCGRLLQKTEPDGSDTKYRWSTEPDRLVEILNEKNETYSFVHDQMGNIVEEKGFDDRVSGYRYDAAGRCVEITNALGERIRLERDALGQLVRRILPDGLTTAFQFDALGNLISAFNESTQLVFERDIAGRLVKEIQGERSVTTRYDAAGHIIGTESSLGHRVDYVLDGNGDRKEAICAGQSIRMIRDARGLEVFRQLSDSVFLSLTHDSVGRLTQQSMVIGSADQSTGRISPSHVVLARKYDYGVNGLLRQVDDNLLGSRRYEYDRLDRILDVYADGRLTEQFDYDATGNLLRIGSRAANRDAEVFLYASGDRLLATGSEQFGFDAQGRLVRRADTSDYDQQNGWVYRWNAADQLISVSAPSGDVWSYAYDPLGRRISKSKSGKVMTSFIWDRDTLLHEGSEHSLSSWIFEPANFAPVARVDQNGATTVVCDQLGTPIAFCGRLDGVARAHNFTAWGEQTAGGNGLMSCNWRFQGQYFDSESGFHYSRFRFYAPDSGRFISQDPIGIDGGSNLYRYTINPINFIDPYGLSTSSDSQKLGNNLTSGGQSPIGPCDDAHHVVMSNSSDPRMQDLRAVMTGHGVDINDPRNGIWLPRTDGDRVPGDTRTAHKGDGLHSDSYKQEVYDKLMAGAPPPPSKREFLARLRQLKGQLQQGKKFPCKK